MRYLSAGTDPKTTRISRIGLGTWQFGSREWGYGESYAGQEARAIVRRAVELGVTLFDTAEIYGFGRSERILGEAIGEDRESVFLATQGLLSGRYDRGSRPANRLRAASPLFLPENLDRVGDLIATLREVADAHSATPAQIALAWVIHRPAVIAIPGASSVGQLESNVVAADIDLTEAEYQALHTAATRFRPVTGPAVLPGLLRARFN